MNPIRTIIRAFLLLVCSLVVVNLAAQNKFKAISEDESYAVGSVRTINTAEDYYTHTFGKGYSPDLVSLGEAPAGAVPSAEHAGVVADHLANGRWRNYLFTYKAETAGSDGRIGTYTLIARPVKWEKGRASFFTNQTGVIRWTRENRPATANDSTIDPLTGTK